MAEARRVLRVTADANVLIAAILVLRWFQPMPSMQAQGIISPHRAGSQG